MILDTIAHRIRHATGPHLELHRRSGLPRRLDSAGI